MEGHQFPGYFEQQAQDKAIGTTDQMVLPLQDQLHP
jgi:hypothetical protein